MAAPWRTTPLPANWQALRKAARERAGGICEWPGCREPGTDCHHDGDPTDHRLERLVWLCGPHHDHITGVQARASYLRRTKRPAPRHPGYR